MSSASSLARHCGEVFIPQIEVLIDTGFTRVMESFDSIANEANQVAEEAFNRCGQMHGGDECDMGDYVDVAIDEGIEYYETLSALQQTMYNLFAAGLHHLFEQQRTIFDQVLGSTQLAGRIDLSQFPSFTTVDELRLLANTVKHGEGSSSKNLREVRPEIFMSWIERSMTGSTPRHVAARKVASPLAGKDLFITPEDIEGFRGAVVSLWQEAAAALMASD